MVSGGKDRWAAPLGLGYGAVGVNAAPSSGNFGGVEVPTGVPISPPQTISDRPVHVTIGPPRARRGQLGSADHRFVFGS